MNQSNKTLGFIIIGLIIICGGWYFFSGKDNADELLNANIPVNTETVATTSNATTTGQLANGKPVGSTVLPTAKKLETYTNGVYKFTLSYPKEYQTEPFVTFYQLNNVDWRVKASTSKRGIPVISIPILRIDQGSVPKGKKYPLYFTAEVRVGVSPDTAQCYSPDDGYVNQKITSVLIGGITFKKFDFEDAGMMKYVKGSSYRTVHGNLCYVIEQIKAGTIYKDETMLPGYTEKELDAIYNKTTAIVYSLKFIK
jgi:hypothetical protein